MAEISFEDMIANSEDPDYLRGEAFAAITDPDRWGATKEAIDGICSNCRMDAVQEIGGRTYHPHNAFAGQDKITCEVMDIYGILPGWAFFPKADL